MDDTQKMLQIILTGQNNMRKELLAVLNKLDKNITKSFDNLETRFEKCINKLDRLLDKLEKRVTKVEQKAASV